MFIVAKTKDASAASQIHAAQKGSTVISRDGIFFIVIGRQSDKDVHCEGVYTNLTGISLMTRETLLP